MASRRSHRLRLAQLKEQQLQEQTRLIAQQKEIQAALKLKELEREQLKMELEAERISHQLALSRARAEVEQAKLEESDTISTDSEDICKLSECAKKAVADSYTLQQYVKEPLPSPKVNLNQTTTLNLSEAEFITLDATPSNKESSQPIVDDPSFRSLPDQAGQDVDFAPTVTIHHQSRNSMTASERSGPLNKPVDLTDVKPNLCRSQPLGDPSTSGAQVPALIGQVLETLASSLRQGLDAPKRVIPTFDGDPLKFFEFLKIFDECITNCVASTSSQLGYLMQYCTGEPHDLIRPCASIASPVEGLATARRLLMERYAARHVVVTANMNNLKGPPIKGDDKSLRKIANAMLSCQITLKAWGYESSLNSQELLVSVLNRLPLFMQDEFHNKYFNKIDSKDGVTFEDLTAYVQTRASMASDFMGRAIAEKRRQGAMKTEVTKKTSVYSTQSSMPEKIQPHANTSVNKLPLSCPECKGNHQLWKCEAFLRKDVPERWKLVSRKNSKICFNCLGSNHITKDCRCKKRCKFCSRSHHSLLHKGEHAADNSTGDDVKQANDSASSQDEHVSGSVQSTGTRVRLKVVPVQVWGSNPSQVTESYAFLDEGSDMSFCTKSLAEKLCLQGKQIQCMIAGMNDTKMQCGQEVSFKVKGLHENKSVYVRKAMAINNLPELSTSIPTDKDVMNYGYLKGISFPDIDVKKVEILIGADVQQAHTIQEVREGKDDQPRAVRTGLGWTLVGPETINGTHDSQCGHVNFAKCDSEVLHLQMQKLFDHEFNEDQDPELTSHSVDDLRALSIMKSSITKLDGHYCMKLPWKEEDITLPDNKSMAEKRLKCLKKKLQADPVLLKQYKAKMNEALSNGYARKLTEQDNNDSGRIWYIPHHCTGSKFRIVFDCSAKYKGTSLNDNLLQGPDNTSSLIGVLLRFRQEHIAVVADIKGMYHQVFVEPSDTDALRFLWWPDGNLSSPPADYKFLVHPFGATSSPSCASFALKQVAAENERTASRETLSTIRKNFYVDDCLKSVSSVDQAIKLIKELSSLLENSGFHLTKYVSNSRDVLLFIDKAERAPSLMDLNLNEDLPVGKTLGVYWNTESDNFEIKVKVCPKPPTRRGILSMMSQLYDPLGFVQPCILPIKRLMQQASKSLLGWDEVVPAEIRDVWEKWLTNLPALERVQVPRCFKSCLESVNYELHCFSDASCQGYGAVCYLRHMHDDRWNCSFVMGKSRVSPSKPVTIPRMELAAAVVAVKLSKVILHELECNIQRVIFWTDSTSVIQYIANTSTRFKTFVANRLAIIHEYTKVSQWRYVDTGNNPADVASRGLDPSQWKKMTIWLNGPEFLYQDEMHWPVQPDVLPQLPENDPELKKQANVHAAVQVPSCLDDLLTHFSVFFQLQKTVAWILRVKSCLKWMCLKKAKPETCGDFNLLKPLSPVEINEATINIVRLVQLQAFPMVMNELTNNNHGVGDTMQCQQSKGAKGVVGPYAKCLGKLCPFLDKGVMKVGGRLQRSTLSIDAKHQMILPSRHHVTEIIIQHYHSREGHGGPLLVLSVLRKQFWVIKGHSTVRRVLNSCVQCKRWNAKVGEQMMAPLPTCRVAPGGHPFRSVGLDYMGPFLIK